MGKMEQTIKSEIIRLAKKQLRATCVPLARDVRRLKRLVRELSKTVRPLKTLGAELEAQRAAELAKLQAAPEEVKAARISPKLIKKLRSKLGVSQGGLAALIGVSAPAVAFWEQGRAKPREQTKAALVALRKLGRRDVKKLLAEKKAARKEEPKKRKRTRPRRR
jgi:DNA-binding transcriptional regulator YiaG